MHGCMHLSVDNVLFYLIFKDGMGRKVSMVTFLYLAQDCGKTSLFQATRSKLKLQKPKDLLLHLQANWKSLRKEANWNTYFTVSAIILLRGCL